MQPGVTEHGYEVAVHWTGNRGTGTSGYREYGRDHVVSASGKADIAGSADPTFRGDRDRWNPEELLLAALTQCHMLSYLHVAVQRGFTVVEYDDRSSASLDLHRDGSGELVGAVLRPVVTIAEADRVDDARAAHERAAELCFIARSVAFPVRHEPEIRVRHEPEVRVGQELQVRVGQKPEAVEQEPEVRVRHEPEVRRRQD